MNPSLETMKYVILALVLCTRCAPQETITDDTRMWLKMNDITEEEWLKNKEKYSEAFE